MRLTIRAARNAAAALALLACSPDKMVGPATKAVTLDVTAASVPQLVITEIMPDPSKVADASGEWFEIYNAGSDAVDLLGYKIASFLADAHTIGSSVSLPAG